MQQNPFTKDMLKSIFLKICFFSLLIGTAFITRDTTDSIWKILDEVDWKRKYNAEFDAMVAHPVFGKSIKELEGKVIDIPGFIIPVDYYSGDGEYIVLSRYPASSCFFCGGGGPESVVEVYLKNKKDYYSVGRVQHIKGKLKLNPNDFNHLIYILEDAEVLRK